MMKRLFLFCWLVFALHFATNSVREVYPALSLGDHLSFDVSDYAGLHPDIFVVPGRGAFINNNPGASIMGALPYALARPLIDNVVAHVQRIRAAAPETARAPAYDSPWPMAREFYEQARARGLDVKLGLGAAVMQAGLMAPLSALGVVVMCRLLLSLRFSMQAAVSLALLYGLATPVLYRTAQLNHNLLLGHSAFFAFVLLWRPWDSAPPRRRHYLAAGLLAGWTVVLDYSGVVALAALSGYAASRWSGHRSRSWLNLAAFAAGAAASLGALLAYQWLCFGHPLYPAQRYMPPTPLSVYGYNGMDWPHLDLLWDTAFGNRFGLFTSAPLLLLVFYVPAWLRPSSRLLGRHELSFVLAFTGGFFLFCAANQFGRLQFNSGVRYVVPVVPFLFLLVAGVLRRLPSILAIAFGIAGTYWSWALAMYRDVERGRGIVDAVVQVTSGNVHVPWLTTLEHLGYVAPERGATLQILLFLVVGAGAWWLYAPLRARRRHATLGRPTPI